MVDSNVYPRLSFWGETDTSVLNLAKDLDDYIDRKGIVEEH